MSNGPTYWLMPWSECFQPKRLSMKPSLSIDFGSSYTKVALRCGQNQPTEILSDRHALILDLLNCCIPSQVALDQRNGKDEWFSGTRAINSVPGSGIRVFRNWKKEFFSFQHA